MLSIKEAVHKQLEKINKANKKIAKLQEECQHEGVIKTYGSNTGNFCPDDDCYWTNFHCECCGKRWTVEGSV